MNCTIVSSLDAASVALEPAAAAVSTGCGVDVITTPVARRRSVSAAICGARNPAAESRYRKILAGGRPVDRSILVVYQVYK